MTTAEGTAPKVAAGAATLVLLTRPVLMTLDSSVINVSIATVAGDVGVLFLAQNTPARPPGTTERRE